MTHTHIALCSDTHFWPGAEQAFGSQLQPRSDEIQAALLADLRAAQPDIILHLGDLTCGGGSFGMPAAAFQTALATLIENLRSIGAAFYGLPGNHDLLLGEDWSYAEGLLGLGAGLGRTIDTPAARLILLNAQGHDHAQRAAALPSDPISGWVHTAELARLEAALASAGSRPVLIFCHQLLRPWQGEQPWADLYGIQNAPAVMAVLARYPNVSAVFQGHAHRLDVQCAPLGDHDGWFVVLPAMIEYPMAWLDLDLQPGMLHCTLRRLPLPELAEQSRQVNMTDWRAGLPAWASFRIGL